MKTRKEILKDNFEWELGAYVLPKYGKECPFKYMDKLVPECCYKCPYKKERSSGFVCTYYRK